MTGREAAQEQMVPNIRVSFFTDAGNTFLLCHYHVTKPPVFVNRVPGVKSVFGDVNSNKIRIFIHDDFYYERTLLPGYSNLKNRLYAHRTDHI